MTALEAKLKLNADFVWEPMPDGCILYCQATGQIVTVNPAAELILTYCDGTASLQEIYDKVLEDVFLPPAEFQAAVQKLLHEKILLPA